jgi:tetratricopeptide (TPR) repeat protein
MQRGGPLEGSQGVVARRFTEDLVNLRRLAGQPSYSTLERLSGHRLKRATMSDVLNGNRVNLPDWRFIHEFVTACRAAAAENRIDENELGTVADWKRHWDGAAGGVIDARFPGRESRPPSWAGQAVEPQREEPIPGPATDQSPDPPGDVITRPLVWGPLPARLPDFVGRETWLEKLREALTCNDRVGLVAIQGLFGVGKTQLAIEYANQHANEYDLVWWVPCGKAEAAHEALADLAVRAGVADVARESNHKGYTELFDVLQHSQRFARWLLIFDNADEPEDIKGLIPPLPGDVIVTTRSTRWEASGELLELDVFDRAESVEFLRRRMRKFTEVAAHRLAEGVGDLPLLLEHAVESHVGVNEYLDRLSSEPLVLLDEQPADYHATIASVWRMALDQLRADASDAHDLLRCLAFFGADPVPRESLERGSYLADVSIHGMLREPIRLAGAIGKLRRAGLLRINLGTRSLVVHRITGCMVRDLIARTGLGERFRHDVHLLLSAADPLTPDDPATWLSYEELRCHAAASGAVACQQELVRKFAVNLVRYLNAAGDPRAAVSLADEALSCWGADVLDDSLSADCGMAMRLAKADALFAQGKWPEAFQLRQESLATMYSDPGRLAAEIIALEGMSGARCRVTGNFAEALAVDRESVRVHVAKFGDDDPRTFDAVNSLIADLALTGSGAEAATAADSVYRDCLAFYGDARHPAVLAARNILGRCQWLSGEYDKAVGIMAEAHGEYDELADSGTLDENHPWRLIHEIDYAIARRDKGLIPADLQVLADDMQEVRRQCWRTLGANHPQTLAASVVLASILRRIGGRAGEVMRLLEDAGRRYQLTLPGHPYGYACSAFLAAVRHQAPDGSSQRAVGGSALIIQGMLDQLGNSVGNTHPLSLTAMNSLANSLARAGELDTAVKYRQEALAGFRDLLGPDHPHTLVVEANAESIQSHLTLASGSSLQADLVEIDFTPLPL